MRLFLDLDETLVFTYQSLGKESLRPVNVKPTAKAVFPDESFDVYLRPDLALLKDQPFSILSHSVQKYAEAIAGILKDEGLPILDVFGREYLQAGDELTMEPSFLIDNLPETSSISIDKMLLLPGGVYLKVDAWEPMDPIQETHQGYAHLLPSLSEGPVALELVRTPGSRSLAKRLADVVET